MKLFRKKIGEEFTLVQKINFTQEECGELLATRKSILQPPGAQKITKKTFVVEQVDEEISDGQQRKY